MKNLLKDILDNKRPVREIIDEAAQLREADISLDDSEMDEAGDAGAEDSGMYQQLFVRRFNKGSESPKRARVKNAAEAVDLFFDWAKDPKYRQMKVEIFTNNPATAKKFYRFCLKNREMLEQRWNESYKELHAVTGMQKWLSALKVVKDNVKAKDETVSGTLFPFESKPKSF